MAAIRTALFSKFQDAFRDIIRQLSNSELDEDGVDSIIFRLEQLSVHLVRLCNVDLMNNQTERLISNTIMLLRSYNDVNRQASSFHVPDIAQALGVSRSTIFRRMRTFGLSVGQRMTYISDENLVITIRQVQQDFPNAGYRRLCSQLLIRGIRVPQMAVRNAMHRIDPEGVAMRWLQLVPRRSSNVPGPLSLWHIDGN
ncbi:uncharacterized protein LOC110239820, partial [Paramuricea clavata]